MITQIEKFLKMSEDEQIEFLQDLEFEDDPQKWSFFTAIISRSDVEDLVKIETLDLLSASDIPKRERENITKVVLEVAKHEHDIIIRQHSVMCLQNDDLVSDEVIEYAKVILLDSNANIDLRYNALVIVNNHLNKRDLIPIFKELTKDKAFASKAENWLKEI